MYAIFQAGSRQHQVSKGDELDVDLLDLSGDKPVEFKDVLFVNDGKNKTVGAPFLTNYVIKAEVVMEEFKAPKVISYKFKRRKNSKTKQGHRQKYTRVRITEIAEV